GRNRGGRRVTMPSPKPGARSRPIERFLGPEEVAGGPFALLGVGPGAITDDLVLSALDRQIERIARHPECDTPEADEVRLALHAAAAQLLDPVVRRHLIAKWTGKAVGRVVGGTDLRSANRWHGSGHEQGHRSGPVSEKLLEGDAILAMALFGGWNLRSMRRLLKVAHARGLNNRQVAMTLRGLAGRRRPSRPPTRSALPMR